MGGSKQSDHATWVSRGLTRSNLLKVVITLLEQ